jgi:hypothetical protein
MLVQLGMGIAPYKKRVTGITTFSFIFQSSTLSFEEMWLHGPHPYPSIPYLIRHHPLYLLFPCTYRRCCGFLHFSGPVGESSRRRLAAAPDLSTGTAAAEHTSSNGGEGQSTPAQMQWVEMSVISCATLVKCTEFLCLDILEIQNEVAQWGSNTISWQGFVLFS